jgi:hypothetical protein
MADWIPTREQDLVDLCQKWAAVLVDSAKITAYGWAEAECTEVLGKINAFLTARSNYEADNSTAKRIVKDEAKGEAIDAMRDFANSSIRFNKKMDDAAKLYLGIHPKDITPTAHGTPTSQPGTEVENTRNHYEHQVRAINTERGDHSKPVDAYGVRYAWQVSPVPGGGEKPATGAELGKKNSAGRRPTLYSTPKWTKGRRRIIPLVTRTAKTTRGHGLRWKKRLSVNVLGGGGAGVSA